MLVRATQRGFYLWLRNVDEVFEIPDNGSLFSATWMTKVPTVAGKPVVSLNVPAVGGVQPVAKPSLNIPTPAKSILGLPNKPPSPAAPLAPRPRFPLFGSEAEVPPAPPKTSSFFGPGVKTP